MDVKQPLGLLALLLTINCHFSQQTLVSSFPPPRSFSFTHTKREFLGLMEWSFYQLYDLPVNQPSVFQNQRKEQDCFGNFGNSYIIIIYKRV